MSITPYSVVRRTVAFLLTALLAVVLPGWLAPSAQAQNAAEKEKQRLNQSVDERLGLLERSLRIWKLPVRYTAARSPYFRPGLPPYRQQPEKAQAQRPPIPEPEPVAAPAPTGGGSSSSDSGGSDSSGDGGSSGGSGGSSGSSGGGSSDDGGNDGFGPTPTPGTA